MHIWQFWNHKKARPHFGNGRTRIIAFFEKHNYKIGMTIEWGFAILCCAHMPRKIPKQRGGLNFVDPEISIYLGLG